MSHIDRLWVEAFIGNSKSENFCVLDVGWLLSGFTSL